MRRRAAGFTLVEIMISLALFSLLMVATSSAFFTIQQSSLKERQNIELIENLRWGENYILSEIRECNSSTLNNLSSYGLDGFCCTNPISSSKVWYWRGNDGMYGNATTIYRGKGNTFSAACSADQELVNFVVNNTNNATGVPVFNVSSGSLRKVTIEMKVRPYPGMNASAGNREYRVRTTVRTRN